MIFTFSVAQTQELRRCFKEVFKGKADGEDIGKDNDPQDEYHCEKMCVINHKCTFFQFMLGPATGSKTKCKLFKGEVTQRKVNPGGFTTYKLLNKCCAKKILDGNPDADILEMHDDKNFYSIKDCRKKCEANLDCQVFRVKKSADADTAKAACALYRAGAGNAGTTGGADKVATFKLKAC